ncbi:hypothetical protein TNCV_2969211 [Trichonephila clavipes]|nr:hypothetical protein TNCV_2969211 [Trichonephila clavipes]
MDKEQKSLLYTITQLNPKILYFVSSNQNINSREKESIPGIQHDWSVDEQVIRWGREPSERERGLAKEQVSRTGGSRQGRSGAKSGIFLFDWS